MTNNNHKYWAFISYRHRDRKWGDWLHRALETYRLPAHLRKSHKDKAIPKRLYPVFRDREELPTGSDLGDAITGALDNSRTLIVICSPRSAKSRWVNEEISYFKRIGRSDQIVCLIVDGEPNASDNLNRPEEECFAESLRYDVDSNGNVTACRVEPIAADVRPDKDGKRDALMKLIAGTLGIGFTPSI